MLKAEIMQCSQSKDWQVAKKEWKLREVFQEPGGQCLCGHYPITDHCVIHNHLTGHDAIVGNCCVKRFMGKGSTVFAALRRIKKNLEGRVNYETLVQAWRDGEITTEEGKRYKALLRKRNTSLLPHTLQFIQMINVRLLGYYTRT